MTYYSSFKNHYRRMYTTPDYKENLRCTPSDEPCWCPAAQEDLDVSGGVAIKNGTFGKEN